MHTIYYIQIGFDLRNDSRELRKKFNVQLRSTLDLSVLIGNSSPFLTETTLDSDRQFYTNKADFDIINQLRHTNIMGLSNAVRIYLGLYYKKDKNIACSSWANPRLTNRQILYAANDAYLALKVYSAWQKNLASQEKLSLCFVRQ